MLKIDTITKNKTYFNPDPNKSGNEGIWDLTASSLKITGTRMQFEYAYVIKSDESMRSDLISYRKYGDQGKMGSLLKLNGIANPFAIEAGEILYIPQESSVEDAFNKRKELNLNGSSINNERNKGFMEAQKSKKSTDSKGREEYLAELKLRNKTANEFPPNILEEGERPIVTKSGLIFFGPDATSPNG